MGTSGLESLQVFRSFRLAPRQDGDLCDSMDVEMHLGRQSDSRFFLSRACGASSIVLQFVRPRLRGHAGYWNESVPFSKPLLFQHLGIDTLDDINMRDLHPFVVFLFAHLQFLVCVFAMCWFPLLKHCVSSDYGELPSGGCFAQDCFVGAFVFLLPTMSVRGLQQHMVQLRAASAKSCTSRSIWLHNSQGSQSWPRVALAQQTSLETRHKNMSAWVICPSPCLSGAGASSRRPPRLQDTR